METILIAVVVAVIVAVVVFAIRRGPEPQLDLDIPSEPTRLGSEPLLEPKSEATSQTSPVLSAPRFHKEHTKPIDAGIPDQSLVPLEFIVLDLETTGLSPQLNEIIEIGAVRVNRDSEKHPTFQTLVKPAERLPTKITQITGITNAMLDKDGRPLSEVLVQFKEFIGDLPIVTFNAAFDMGFLWRAATRHGVAMDNRYTCALKMARRAYPGLSSYRLADLAKMGNLSAENTHRAIGDCMRTAPIFMASVAKIGERIVWEVPKVDWRVSVQYHKERDANRAFVAETLPFEASDPEKAVTRYRSAMVCMYDYERLIHNWSGDAKILDRLTLLLGKLGRDEDLISCVDSFLARFPDAQSSMMTSILERKLKAENRLKSSKSSPDQ
jgi:DNA polymerase III epsilon subunit family exonuclease